ncbi:DeoR/GlpR family DNA-binding transcription regulator [Mesorhizobium sp. KR1-2]|uniref:DeoR/GlpR family DNA-binding transcription regulator n=1 Tax=Mesorhizobium sp. KR1-2 TaxID=3156609 RepID=UPI0032B4695E
MPSLKATERHQKIMDQLSATGRTDVSELAEALGVSTVTVRADLLYLEKNQVLRRIRGGAISVRPSRYERPVDINASLRSNEKNAIAALAAEMIRDGETIIMDTGSTIAALAALFPKTLTDIAVVTNSLAVATELADHPGATVIITGGTLRPKLNSLISPFGDLILKEINADIAFMSCAGVDAEKGFTNSNWQEAEIKKTMIRAASRVVFLADHSKLKHVATARIAPLSEADMLITDSNASAETLKELRAAGLEIVVA